MARAKVGLPEGTQVKYENGVLTVQAAVSTQQQADLLMEQIGKLQAILPEGPKPRKRSNSKSRPSRNSARAADGAASASAS